jgi:AcrR family transcriptional regulator
MEIADREGIKAVSMRRVASELGVGTMTLYHYVENKQELLDLMNDAMMAELLVPDEKLQGGWREALFVIAHASLDTWRRHSWLQEGSAGRPSFGPNAMRHFEQSLAAVAGTGLPMDRRTEVVAQVDDYTAGYVQREGDMLESAGQDSWDELIRPSSEFLEDRLAGGGYPHIEEFLGGERFPDVVRRLVQASTPDDRFDRGLNRLLDGVALEIERARGA